MVIFLTNFCKELVKLLWLTFDNRKVNIVSYISVNSVVLFDRAARISNRGVALRVCDSMNLAYETHPHFNSSHWIVPVDYKTPLLPIDDETTLLIAIFFSDIVNHTETLDYLGLIEVDLSDYSDLQGITKDEKTFLPVVGLKSKKNLEVALIIQDGRSKHINIIPETTRNKKFKVLDYEALVGIE